MGSRDRDLASGSLSTSARFTRGEASIEHRGTGARPEKRQRVRFLSNRFERERCESAGRWSTSGLRGEALCRRNARLRIGFAHADRLSRKDRLVKVVGTPTGMYSLRGSNHDCRNSRRGWSAYPIPRALSRDTGEPTSADNRHALGQQSTPAPAERTFRQARRTEVGRSVAACVFGEAEPQSCDEHKAKQQSSASVRTTALDYSTGRNADWIAGVPLEALPLILAHHHRTPTNKNRQS